MRQNLKVKNEWKEYNMDESILNTMIRLWYSNYQNLYSVLTPWVPSGG